MNSLPKAFQELEAQRYQNGKKKDTAVQPSSVLPQEDITVIVKEIEWENQALELCFQNFSQETNVPEVTLFETWMASVFRVLSGKMISQAEITLRIVDESEMIQLNSQYRHQNKSTNVLAFLLESDPLIGDIVMCAPIISNEAKIQHKAINAHWAHLTIHGVLHLLGYDHILSPDAEEMENMEIKILNNLGFSNPYDE